MNQKTENWNKYVQETAKLMQLKLTPEYLPGVIKNFNILVEIAALVTEFDLPDDIEITPTFKP